MPKTPHNAAPAATAFAPAAHAPHALDAYPTKPSADAKPTSCFASHILVPRRKTSQVIPLNITAGSSALPPPPPPPIAADSGPYPEYQAPHNSVGVESPTPALPVPTAGSMHMHALSPLDGSSMEDQGHEQHEQQEQLLLHAGNRPDQLHPHHQHELLPPKLKLKLELDKQQQQQEGEQQQQRRQQQERYDAAVAAAGTRAARAAAAAQQQQHELQLQGHKQLGVQQNQVEQAEAPKVPLLARIRRYGAWGCPVSFPR